MKTGIIDVGGGFQRFLSFTRKHAQQQSILKTEALRKPPCCKNSGISERCLTKKQRLSFT